MVRNANRMAEAVEKLAGDFAAHANTPVTYMRGGDTIANVDATITRGGCEILDGEVPITHEFVDFIVAAASMGAAFIPARGDRITDQTGAMYEVTAPAPMNVYDRIGPAGTMLKIHTKGPI